MKKGENGSRENIAMLPWKFNVEFDDNNVLSCKLLLGYSYLHKTEYHRHFIHPQDIDNLFSSCASSVVERARFTSESSTFVKNANVPRKVVSFSGQVLSPLEYTKRSRSKKEKSTGSTGEEDSCVAKSHSEQSVFLENGIDDGAAAINERGNKASGSRCDSSWDYSLRDSDRRRGNNSSDDRREAPPVSRDSRKKDRRKEERSLEELLTDTMDEGIRTDPCTSSLYTIYKRSRDNSRNAILTEVDKIQLAGTNSESSGKFVYGTSTERQIIIKDNTMNT
ncbi:hypothetical protein APICC_07921 [Apis cerana cerana]|uniref:Uncharacterized protein n=1 Tax=Apis cerana cerana TaxID=94128 RepID=A0A2A3EGD7_APICC|nr:hypothetical protein APICC_07921 [Apis cerana cerana]